MESKMTGRVTPRQKEPVTTATTRMNEIKLPHEYEISVPDVEEAQRISEAKLRAAEMAMPYASWVTWNKRAFFVFVVMLVAIILEAAYVTADKYVETREDFMLCNNNNTDTAAIYTRNIERLHQAKSDRDWITFAGQLFTWFWLAIFLVNTIAHAVWHFLLRKQSVSYEARIRLVDVRRTN